MTSPIIDIPATWNVVCIGGRTFDRTISVLDENGDAIDLSTGFTGSALVKLATTDADGSAVLTFTTTDSSMILGNGTIRLVKAKTATAALQVTAGHVDTVYQWDGQVTDGSSVSSPLWDGTFTLDASDTR